MSLVAISFVSRSDAPALQRIQRLIGKTLPRYEIPGIEPKRPLESRPQGRPARPAGQGKPAARRGAPPERHQGKGRPGSSKRPSGPPARRGEPVIRYR